jgi:hypothetical protein
MLLNISNKFYSFNGAMGHIGLMGLMGRGTLIQEPEQPEWYLIAFATFHLVDSEDHF